ncbi:MAG: histidinol-phosphate transaminase [Actinobacteria bacterium]|nr:MAG: histidinol-phosphate transaminase [Actinomycetota bacterium]
MGKINPRPEIARLRAYEAPEPTASVILAANENPDNLPAPVLEEIREIAASTAFNRYPDARVLELRKALARQNGVEVENVIVGNGGDEILVQVCLAFGGMQRASLTFPPTFSMYEIISVSTGTAVVSVPRRADFSVDEEEALRAAAGADLVFLSNPNNPTGNLEGVEAVERLASATKGLFVLDEAYHEFAGVTYLDLIDELENLLVLRTFSKAFSMAGLRVGYLIARPEVIAELQKVRLPYNANAFSQAAALAALKYRPLFEERIRTIVAERERVREALGEVRGVEVLPSRANFLLLRLDGIDAFELWRELLERDVLVRNFAGDERLERCLRVTIGSRAENDAFLAALGEAIQED